MAKKAQRRENPQSAEFYDSRRGDLSLWSSEPTAAKVTGNASVVYSIRLAIDELEAIRQAAGRAGRTVSDFIRTIVLAAIRVTPSVGLARGEETKAPVSMVRSQGGDFARAEAATATA